MTTHEASDGWYGLFLPPSFRVRAAGIDKLGFWLNLKQCPDSNTQKLQDFYSTKMSFEEGVSQVSVIDLLID